MRLRASEPPSGRLFAGANHISWRRFLLFNAAGGLYALRCMAWLPNIGQAIGQITKPAAFGLAVVAAIAIGELLVVVHRHETELDQAAELALPRPLSERNLVRAKTLRPHAVTSTFRL